MYYVKLLLASLQFMTRLPIPERYTQTLTLEDYPRGIVTFPVVGLVVGIITALVFAMLQSALGPLLASVFAVLSGAAVTGAFHLDGLADTADGVFSARTRERMLEIMRDSQIGTNGALALIFHLLLKIVVIYQLATIGAVVYSALIAGPIIGRGLNVLLMYRQTYARESGVGNIYIGKISQRDLFLTLLISALLLLLLLGFQAIVPVAFSLIFVVGYRWFIQHKLGGQTGDTLGAAIELLDLIFILLILLCIY